MKRSKIIVTFLSSAALTFTMAACGKTVPPQPVRVESIELDSHVKNVFVGEDFTLTYEINPENADNKNVTWSVENPEIASIEDGHVITLAAGTTTVAVVTEDGNKRDECVVNVGKHVEDIFLKEHEKFLVVGEEITVRYNIVPADAKDQRVTWSSDNTEAVTVAGGNIRAVAPGQATVTVATVDGNRQDTVLIHVAEVQQNTVLDKNSAVVEAEGVHQTRVDDFVFDLVGFEAAENALGTIKKAALGNTVYNGMIYNRSLIKGLKSVTVDYSGDSDHLFILFTDYFMEDMNFDGEKVADCAEIAADGKTYFMLYTDVETKTQINSITIKRDEADATDLKMIYNKNTELGGARSVSKTTTKEESYIVLENNPQANNNNYSQGKTSGHTNNDSWYRWNGRYFVDSENLGTDFRFTMTLGIGYDRMVDPSKYFHINVWPQFSYGGTRINEYTGLEEPDDNWIQTYIGNDNYEPLGGEHPLHPTDEYAKNAFAGRFFTDYDWYTEDWQVDYEQPGDWLFADPDIVKIPDQELDLTMREAYEMYNLPFWCLEFHVYIGEDNDAYCDIKINGMLIDSTYIFDNYLAYEGTPNIHIHTLPMHLVNYGVDADGTPGESYTGMFTYPRLMAAQA